MENDPDVGAAWLNCQALVDDKESDISTCKAGISGGHWNSFMYDPSSLGTEPLVAWVTDKPST